MNSVPREILYSIFEYLTDVQVVYSFFELNSFFKSTVHFYIGKRLFLVNVDNNLLFQYAISTVLPSLGLDIEKLSIGQPHCLSNYIESIKLFCPYLNCLEIFSCSNEEDIRLYARLCLHRQVKTLTLLCNGRTINDHQLVDRLLKKSNDLRFQGIRLAMNIRLHLSSTNDLNLLKRYCDSEYIESGLYQIECPISSSWLTTTDEDLKLLPTRLTQEHIFSINHADFHQSSLEYEIRDEKTKNLLSVLILDEIPEERFVSASILSSQRKISTRTCLRFSFEKVPQADDLFLIRPCYYQARPLKISGKRIINHWTRDETTSNHCFRLQRVFERNY